MLMKLRSQLVFVARATAWSTVWAMALTFGCRAPEAQWPQWGGPNRNFTIETAGLADQWPEKGPEKLWHRELGDGYSTILVNGDELYTMYRIDEDEFTVALDARTGETIWEHKNPSPTTRVMREFGAGPHSTPLLVGHRLYTIGSNAVMHCFNTRTGKVLWKHDLVKELGAPIPPRGYACSPIAYKNTLIVPVDRERPEESGDHRQEGEEDEEKEGKAKKEVEGQTLVAFDQKTGAVVWKSQDAQLTYSSPLLTNFDGEEQLVLVTAKEVAAVDPNTGKLLWRHESEPEGSNITTPVWDGESLIYYSSAYDAGSHALELERKDGKTVPEQLWYSRKMRVHHGNVIRIGDHVYGSSGDFGPAFFMGMNLKTGKVAWRERGFKKATCVCGDGKLIILDEDGQLALATVTPEGMTVHSKCKITEQYSWTTPTLVGTTLYVRDRKHIMALDLGRS